MAGKCERPRRSVGDGLALFIADLTTLGGGGTNPLAPSFGAATFAHDLRIETRRSSPPRDALWVRGFFTTPRRDELVHQLVLLQRRAGGGGNGGKGGKHAVIRRREEKDLTGLRSTTRLWRVLLHRHEGMNSDDESGEARGRGSFGPVLEYHRCTCSEPWLYSFCLSVLS